MKSILHIVGNRPQFIKLAVLHRQLKNDSSFSQKIIHTGQHFSHNMSDIFFDELKIPSPDINFNLQHPSPNLFIANAADLLQQYLEENSNSVVFVYGDTNTTAAAAIAAVRCKIPLLHFEAGVRTNDISMPEELNRIITDRLANVNYCCTYNNFKTMQEEGYGGIVPSQLFLTGDLMLDAFLKIEQAAKNVIDEKDYIICTIHREANLSNKTNLSSIIDALNKLHSLMQVVMPIHPHTQKKMNEFGLVPKFKTIPALGYGEMKTCLANANFVITDSGGTSREAYFSKKKSLIIMDNPFWPEIIDANCSISCSADTQSVLQCFQQLTNLHSDFSSNIFGDGNAAEKIHQHISAYMNSL